MHGMVVGFFTPLLISWSRPMLRGRAGGSMPGCENRGIMIPDGAHTAHQLLGAVSRFIRSKEFWGQLCAHVRLRMDNTSPVAYMSRVGGTRSLVLYNLALALWEWAFSQNIFWVPNTLRGTWMLWQTGCLVTSPIRVIGGYDMAPWCRFEGLVPRTSLQTGWISSCLGFTVGSRIRWLSL